MQRRRLALSLQAHKAFGLVGIALLGVAGLAMPGQRANGALAGLERVASGLTAPIFATYAPNDPSRLFIATRGTIGQSSTTATIRILDLNTGTLLPTPFLSIPGVNTNGEGGLLGLAFSPDYATTGKFYVNVTVNDSISGTPFSTYVREYSVSANPNVANTSFKPVLTFAQPQDNHNGGWIGFSPKDNYLYINTGDGGNGNDQGTGHTEPGGNAQDLTNNFLGKILRIDVNGDDFASDANRNYAIPRGENRNPFAKVDPNDVNEVDPVGDDEIWAYGVRNPFRASFDRATGDFWIGDVGQDQREEVDFQPASSKGGENYGWRLREGNIQTPGVGGAIPANYVAPVYDYVHPNGGDATFQGNTVTGGVVYRGPDPTLVGKYIFGDSGQSRYWMFDPANPTATVTNIGSLLTPDVGSASTPVAFGEDAKGNVYVVNHYSGNVYRIKTTQVTAGDFDADGDVDGADLLIWQNNLGTAAGATSKTGDANGDGAVTDADLALWTTNFGYSSLNVGATPTSAPVPEPGAAALALIALAAARRGVAAGRRR